MPRHRVELTPQMRTRICELRAIGWSYRKIKEYHREIPFGTIKTTCRREPTRDDNKTRPRSGTPRKLTKEQYDHIYNFVEHRNPYIIMPDLLAEVDHAVKKRSIQYLLREINKRKWA